MEQEAIKKKIKISFLCVSFFEILFQILKDIWIKFINFSLEISSLKI
jgi:hypothetical protein